MTKESTSIDGSSLAPAITRAAAILDVLAGLDGRSAGPSELARRLGLPKSSVSNLCATLVDTGLLRRTSSGFALGRRLAELGGAYVSTIDVVQEFYERAPLLPAASDETIQLAVLIATDMTYLARHDGNQPVRLTSEIGRRLPANCTATGKAALATLDDQEVARRYAGLRSLPGMTARSHRTVSNLLRDLDEVRRNGYAIDDEETMDGVVCYGVAIPRRGPNDDIYAVSVTLLKARASAERRDSLLRDLEAVRAQLASPLRPAD